VSGVYLRKAENDVERIHSDPKGIPTIGKGTALVVKGGDDKYALHEDYMDRLRTATGDPNLTLSEKEQKLLNDSVVALNKGDVDEAKKLIPIYKDGEKPESGSNKFSLTATDDGMKEMSLSDMRIARDAFLEDINKAGREQGLSTERINDLKSKLRHSEEMIGFASARYNMGPGERMPKTAKAVVTGDRAEAAFEMQYRTNEGKSKGLANRREIEAGLVLGQNNDAAKSRLEKLREERKSEIDAYHSATGLKPDTPGKANAGQAALSDDHQQLATDLAKDDGPEAELILKEGADLTKGELRQIMAKRNHLPEGPEKDRLNALEQEHFSGVYGDDPVEQDATGRTIEPKAKRTVAEQPVPAKTSSGENLNDALKELGERIVVDKNGDSKTRIAQALQVGLNLALQKAQEKQQPQNQPKRPSLFNALKVDGIVGPKTRQATKAILAKTQPGTAEEGLALGQFKRIVDEGRRRPVDPDDLRQSTSKIFGPLFRGPEKAAPKVSHEGVGLQLALNKFGEGRFTPLKEDGFIGPKTADAFGKVMKVSDPDDFLSGLGERLGFFG